MAKQSKRASTATPAGRKGGKGRKSSRSNRLKAMEHPLRARILRTLIEREIISPAELSRALAAELSHVSYHVRRLEELDCAELVSTRPVRGALEHFYRATERHLLDQEEWEELDPIVAEDLVCGFVQRILDDFVDSRKAEIVGADGNFHISRTPMMLDPEGLQESIDLFERSRLEMAEIERRSAERRSEKGTRTIPASSSLLVFEVPRRSLDG